MKLSRLKLESIKEFILGDNGFTPGLSGLNILNLFNPHVELFRSVLF